MRFLLDEQLHPLTARAMTALCAPDDFSHVYDHNAGGMQDEHIPEFCRDQGIEVLITANVRDFGARRVYFANLLSADVHLVVVRPGQVKFRPEIQVSIISGQWRRTRQLLGEASEPRLVKVTPSSAEPKSLDELIEEATGPPLP